MVVHGSENSAKFINGGGVKWDEDALSKIKSQTREGGESGEDTKDDRELLGNVMEYVGDVVKVGAGEGRRRIGRSVKGGNQRDNGEGEEEGSEWASLFESIGDQNDEV